MGYWTYEPRFIQSYKDRESHMHFIQSTPDNPTPAAAFTNFFKQGKIQKLLSDNDWFNIFKEWQSFEGAKISPGSRWGSTLLADFLYYNNIDFWNYLPQTEDPRTIMGYIGLSQGDLVYKEDI